MGAKILIVDDDKNDLVFMQEILEENGYEVVSKTNGADALDALEKNGFSAILIDIQIPTLSGYDLLRLMREKIDHQVKMAFVSILPKEKVAMKDVDFFIQKPFSSEEFLKQVREIAG